MRICRTPVHLAAALEMPRWTRENDGEAPDFKCPDCGEFVKASDIKSQRKKAKG